MVAVLYLTSVDMRFDGCRGKDGPAEEDNGDSLTVYISQQQQSGDNFTGTNLQLSVQTVLSAGTPYYYT